MAANVEFHIFPILFWLCQKSISFSFVQSIFIFDYNREKDETDFQIIPFRKTNLQTGMISEVEIDIGCSFH